MIDSAYWLLILAIASALIFDIMNGFHDAANSIATVVSTRVLSPYVAVVWAAFFNLIAMLIFGPRVAETISQIVKIEPGDPTYLWVIFSGIVGAFFWDLVTWILGLPTSSSHALIGGFAGSGVAYAGWKVLELKKIFLIIQFIFFSPLIGFVLGFLLMWLLFWLFRKSRPGSVDRVFRKGQLFSAALYSIGHGANDAQKTMGIILALLIAKGVLAPGTHLSIYQSNTFWIILASHLAMSVGTLLGGWRIVKTMGMRITKLKPIGGFSAESAGAVTIFMATILGIPISTTHTITGAIVGVGCSTTTFSRIKWGIATRIIWAWILTIPSAALLAALIFYGIEWLI